MGHVDCLHPTCPQQRHFLEGISSAPLAPRLRPRPPSRARPRAPGGSLEEPGRSERAPIASGGGMRRSEEARVSEEAVRRKGGGGGPRKSGMG